MEPPGGRDSRFNLGYSMNLLSGETASEIYGNPNLGRPSTSLQQLSPRHTMVSSACGGRGLKSDMYDERGMSSQSMGLEGCGVNDISEDTYSSLQSKKSPPSNGKKTKGRVKIKMEYIENKLRRYTTFSKRKTGIMKKAYELSTLTGTQVMLLVASETGHVYTFATRKLQPMITSEAGKALIQTCLNSPDPPAGSAGGDQRMSATGFEETELTYNISDEDSKDAADGVACTYSSTSEDEDDATEDILESIAAEPEDDATAEFPTIPKESDCSSNKIPKKKKFNSDEKSKLTKSICTSQQSKNIYKETVTVSTPVPCVVPNTLATSIPTTTLPTLTLENGCEETTDVCTPLVTSSVPFLLSNTLATTSTVIPTTASTTQISAVPLLLQTSAGVGYATTADGILIGMLQGPNINQPQLVAIPMNSVPDPAGQKKLQNDTHQSK